METKQLSKKERKKLIGRIGRASGIAQYAIDEKMTDEQVIEAANHLDVFALVKSANDYNRHCQSQKTAEANAKLKQFLDPQNSEIYKAGQWLFNALSKRGESRQTTLLEKDLVHKDNYNEAVEEMRTTIEEQKQGIQEQTAKAKTTISHLEVKINSLRRDLQFIQDYITYNYDLNTWQNIAENLQNNSKAS